MPNRSLLCAGAVLSVCVSACGGTVSPGAPSSTGSPGTDGGTTPPVGNPKADAGNVDAGSQEDAATGPLAAVCDGVSGLTGQAVLDAIVQPPPGTFSRWVYPAGPPSSDDPVPLTVSTHYDNGAVLCTPAMPTPPPNPGTQPASVGVTVQVSFRTADGVFNESFPATFSGDASFSGTLPVASVQGSYKAIAQADPAGSGTPVTFFGQLDGTTATVSGGVVHGEPFGGFGF